MSEELRPPAAREPSSAAAGGMITLAELMNIIWRRRGTILLITLLGLVAGLGYSFLTKPLYRATAQVRPGIISYSETGGPVREWYLKDVVRWFRTRIYWQDMKDDPVWEHHDSAPIILAEFIPRGPQNLQGGNVITLQTLSPDPQEAEAILQAAIGSFERQASEDSLSSTLHLTRGGLAVRKQKIHTSIRALDTEKARLELEIAEAQEALKLVAADVRRVDLDLDRIAATTAFHERSLNVTQQEIQASLGRLAAAQQALEHIQARDGDAAAEEQALLSDLGRDEVTRWLLANAIQDRQVRASELLMKAHQLGQYVYQSRVRVDSLQHQIDMRQLDKLKLELRRDVDLHKADFDIRQKIADLELKRDQDLPLRQQNLESDLGAIEVQLTALSPLERIGRIAVSSRPVRPRKLRATAILTVLAFLSSFFVVLALEYFGRHKTVIMAKSRD